ncbi:MAG TPA: TrbI/VirB10 family protein [Verrucomicrobiae bacterium]|nr:TrbI/VirB10 family protein [Verrucomicrobiae bacterium]
MNPRNAITFLRSPTGIFLSFVVLLIFALVFVKGFYDPNKHKPMAASPLTQAEKTNRTSQVLQTIQHEMVPFKPPQTTSAPVTSPANGPAPQQQVNPTFTPISLFAESVATESEHKPLSKFYAPYGRMIPCELIVTIDSSSIQTPIIGLITEDIYHDGRLIIPAGTEVHGSAQADRKRERIASNGGWTLVWQTGEELHLQGIALDRDKDADGEGWGLTDGSAGLRGQLLKTDNLAEIKLFAATFLSGAASALSQTRQTVLGTELLPSLQNAPLQGAENVLATYAQQILDTIQRDGFYVRVPAGTEFYLYVTQTIDKSDARVGGTRFNTIETNEPPTTSVAPRLSHRFNP